MKQLKPAILLNIWFIVLFGLAFPYAVYAIAQVMFPRQANGSMVVVNGKTVGSELLGQNFSKPEYFHPRPSAAGNGYDAANSSGTNLGPTSDKLINGASDGSFAGIKQLAEQYRKENGLAADAIVPVDAVTRSASGLDPDISVANAMLQSQRIATARGLFVGKVQDLIRQNTSDPFAGVFGEQRVNVLKINLALDALR